MTGRRVRSASRIDERRRGLAAQPDRSADHGRRAERVIEVVGDGGDRRRSPAEARDEGGVAGQPEGEPVLALGRARAPRAIQASGSRRRRLATQVTIAPNTPMIASANGRFSAPSSSRSVASKKIASRKPIAMKTTTAPTPLAIHPCQKRRRSTACDQPAGLVAGHAAIVVRASRRARPTRAPRPGRTVMFRRRGALVGRSSGAQLVGAQDARGARPSSRASRSSLPMQRRRPPPNGIQV